MTIRQFSSGNYFGTASSAHIDQQNGTDPVVHYSEKSPITSIDYYSHTGYTTPGYKELRREGKLLPYTDWRQERVIGEVERGSWTITSASHGFSQWSHGLLGPVWIDAEMDWLGCRSFTDAELESELGISYEKLGRDAVQSCAASIYSQGWDGLTFVAELHKVIKMFKNFIKRLLSQNPQELHRMWLEGRYGWRILLFDIEEINELIRGIKVTRDRYKQQTGQGGSEKFHSVHSIESGPGVFTYSRVSEVDWSIRGSMVADIEPPEIGFNPITTAWELITFSFVIDWILDVGQWLEAMSFLVLKSGYVAARGLHFTWTEELLIGTDGFVPTGIYSEGTVDYSSTCTKTFTRRLPTSVSTVPSFNVNLNAWKVIDIIALLAQIMRYR